LRMQIRGHNSVPSGVSAADGSYNEASNAELAFIKLQEDLFTGKIRPNQRLVESDVAEELGISRTPVREALKRLEGLGYLTRLPKGGLVVMEPSPVQIQNMLEIREVLEAKAVMLACERISKAQMEKVAKYHDLCAQAAKERDIDGYLKWNEAFHAALIADCGNDQLISLIHTFRNQFFYRQVVRLFTARDWRSKIVQHQKILNYMRQRKCRLAAEAEKKHILDINKIISGKF